MENNLLPLCTHIFAFIRNESNIVMPIASRVEFCANHECLATFVSSSYDLTMLEQYFMFGSQFLAIKALKQLKVVNRRFNYVCQTPIQEADQFDLSSYDFCELLMAMYRNHQEWRCESMTKELATWLDQEPGLLDPYLLRFIASPFGERRVY